MGNVLYRLKRAPQNSLANSTQHYPGQFDYRPHAHSFNTTDAPWNVTQWIDPLDPHPKVTTMPVILIIRK